MSSSTSSTTCSVDGRRRPAAVHEHVKQLEPAQPCRRRRACREVGAGQTFLKRIFRQYFGVYRNAGICIHAIL